MATVRPALRTEILRELENTPFGKDLFDIEIQKEDFLLRVKFVPKPNFSFSLKELQEPVGNRYYFLTLEAPGQWMLESEEFQHENFSQARGRVNQWARRIEDDYSADKKDFEGLEEFRKQMLEEFDAANIPEGERFSPEEKDCQDRRLDDLQERVEVLYKEKHAQQHQINLMKQQIQRLKDSIDVLDKRTWVLAAANRVINIFKEVKAAVGEVKAITKDFNNLIPDLSQQSVGEQNEPNVDAE